MRSRREIKARARGSRAETSSGRHTPLHNRSHHHNGFKARNNGVGLEQFAIGTCVHACVHYGRCGKLHVCSMGDGAV
eukprot:scaffold36761_cov31-Tisochrysis_lutea.AAC.6